MKINPDPLREWFGYSRMERRASAILLIIIVCVISLRFFVPERNIPIEIISLEVPHDTLKSRGQSGQSRGFTPVRPGKYQGRQVKRQPVELNSCDTAELVKLPGIGPVLSARIIKYRNLLGGFSGKEQLKEVYGPPPETFEKISALVYADTLLIELININTADYRRLSRMPYFEREEINSILKYRQLQGKIRSVDEMIRNKLVDDETAGKVKHYLRFE
jgi:DNA uptake protein ComE-like DNA-binding protein